MLCGNVSCDSAAIYKLGREVHERITNAIDERLSTNLKEYLMPLAGNSSGLYKFRVESYRLFCSKDYEKLHV